MKKRIAILVFYDKNRIIDRYVTYLAREILSVSDRFIFVSNGELNDLERGKLKKITPEVYERPNMGFDSGAYKDVLCNVIGWDELAEYDELILCNDTFYGPFRPMAGIFSEMHSKEADFWGITKHMAVGAFPDHIQSYFIVVRERMLHSKSFRKYWEKFLYPANYDEAIQKFEVPFSKYFLDRGYSFSSFIEDRNDLSDKEIVSNYNYTTARTFYAIKELGLPLLKRKRFICDYQVSDDVCKSLEYIRDHTDYDVSMIWENIIRTYPINLLNMGLHLESVIDTESSKFYDKIKPGIIAVARLYDEIDLPRYAARLAEIDDIAKVYAIVDNADTKNWLRGKYSAWEVSVDNKDNLFSHLLITFKDIILNKDYVLFINNRRKLPEDNEYTFEEFAQENVWDNLLYNRDYFLNMIGRFEEHEEIGVMMPLPDNRVVGRTDLKNESQLREYSGNIINRLEMEKLEKDVRYGWFFANSLCFRTKALKSLIGYNWDETWLEKDADYVQQAIENLIIYISQKEGYLSIKICNPRYMALSLDRQFNYISAPQLEMRDEEALRNRAEMKKRLCVFLFSGTDNEAGEYVKYLLSAITRESIDIVCSVDYKTPDTVAEWLRNNYAKEIFREDNSDLSVYTNLINRLSVSETVNVGEYENILFISDEIYGPIYDLRETLATMDNMGAGIKSLIFQPAYMEGPDKRFPASISREFFEIRAEYAFNADFMTALYDLVSGETDAINRSENFGCLIEGIVSGDSLDDFNPDAGYSYVKNKSYELLYDYRCPFLFRKSFLANNNMTDDLNRALEYIEKQTAYDTDLIYNDVIRRINVLDLKRSLNLDYILKSSVMEYDEISGDVYRDTAVLAHIYYEERVDSCVKYLRNVPAEIERYITTSNPRTYDELKQRLKDEDIGKWHIKMVNNRGRDVGALWIADLEHLKKYRYVCFIHDKKTSSGGSGNILCGDYFHQNVWDNCLKSETYIKNVIGLFENNERIGFLSPPFPLFFDYKGLIGNEWTICYDRTVELADDLGIKADFDPGKSPFAFSNTFWARTDALRPLIDRELKYEDFPEEPLPTDGSISHAIERIYIYSAQHMGYLSGIVQCEEYASMELNGMQMLLSNKMNDIRGLCSSVEWLRNENNRLAAQNNTASQGDTSSNSIIMEKETHMKDYQERFSNYIEPVLRDESIKKYIYGAGKYGRNLAEQLIENGYSFEGFIISDGQPMLYKIYGYPCMYWSDVEIADDDIVIVALSERNYSQVEDKLSSIRNLLFHYDLRLKKSSEIRIDNVFDIRADENLYFVIPYKETKCVKVKENNYKAAVLMNLFYEDQAEYFLKWIDNIPENIDVYVASSNNRVLEAAESIQNRSIHTIKKDNRGRDLSALFVAFKEKFSKYDYVCFVHDKKLKKDAEKSSVDLWIENIWGNTVKSNEYIEQIIRLFEGHKDLGLLVPPEPVGENFPFWYSNAWLGSYYVTKALGNRMRLRADIRYDRPPITLGSAFWCRTGALEKIMEMNLNYEDFPDEPMADDGTISHAIERILAYVAQDAGYKTGTVMTTDYSEIQMSIVQQASVYMARALADRLTEPTLIHLQEYMDKPRYIRSIFNRHKSIYLYGAGQICAQCMEALRDSGYMPEGIIVSQRNAGVPDVMEGVPVMTLDEFCGKSIEDYGIIITVGLKLRNEISDILEDRGLTNYMFWKNLY